MFKVSKTVATRWAVIIVVTGLAGAQLAAGLQALDSPAAVAIHGTSSTSTSEGRPTRSNSSAVVTGDLDKTARWYCDHLSFRQISAFSRVGGRVALLERNGILLEVHEGEHHSAKEPTINLTLLVKNIDLEAHRLEAEGVEIIAGPRDRLDRRIRGALIRDADGRIIRLLEPLQE
jgi:catechol 2,3-dioxygenase-like lactoylglutathione lyase family enzyme